MDINLSKVKKLYDKILGVEEYFDPINKWTSILPEGTDVRADETYQYYSAERLMKIKAGEDPERERVVKLCINAGATIIQFKCLDKFGVECYPDYKVGELI